VLIHGLVDNDLHPARFGGTQRSLGLFRGMARAHEVQVLCIVPNRTSSPREERVHGVTLLRRKAWYTSLAWRLDRLGLAPLQSAADVHAARARRWLAALPGRPDVLAVEFALAGLLGRARAKLDLYLAHNVEADFFATTAGRLRFGRAWCARIRDRERRAVERAGLTVVVSEEDAARMIELHGAAPAKLEVIPNGWDETSIRPPAAGERAAARAQLGLATSDCAALFVGSDVPHNRDAARWIVERMGPAAAKAGVVTIVAGGVGRAIDARAPWLRVLGQLDDLLPVLHASDVGLNPVVAGGGSNVKVPTCLGAGLAVVTTPFGLRGYGSLAPFVTVAEPADFVAAVAARPRGWAARGEAPPEAVSGHAWGTLGEELARRIARRLAPQAAARTSSSDLATRTGDGPAPHREEVA